MRTIFITAVFIFTLIAVPVYSAQELVIGLGCFEPHFIAKDNTGLFTDIIKETFGLLPQYRITFRNNMSFDRLVKELNAGRTDASANIFKGTDIKGYFSDPVFRFTDVAVTLKNRNFVIEKVSDLKGRSLITYQGAKLFWGEKFKKTAESCSDYMEIPEPMTQAKMVAMGRYDVSVGDIYIFLHSIKTWSEKKFLPGQFAFHRIFPDTYSCMGFRDKKICEEFNRALEEIKKNGKYEAIYKRYLHELGYKESSDK